MLYLAQLCSGCNEAPPRPLNLVLISIDTLTPRRMATYGGQRRNTPTIDAIAAGGVRFVNAFSPSPWTLPAHAAMLTGRYPAALAPDPNDRRVYRAAPVLAELFQQAGYRTAAVTGGGFVSAAVGADRGFESFEGTKWSGAPDAAVRWLEAHAEESFFLFYHTYTVHTPYNDRRYVAETEGGRLRHLYAGKPESGLLHLSITCGTFDPTADEREFLLALYDGGVAAADEEVALIWAALWRLRLLPHTVVIVTSDHGEEFWQHTGRAAYHGHSLYDELLRVPLIWYEPGLPTAGQTRNESVGLIDIVPTVVPRFGLGAPDTLDGLDLSRLLEGRGWDVERALFGEGVRHGPRRASVRASGGTLIETTDDEQRGEGTRCPVPTRAARELYLPGDLDEARNVAGQYLPLAGDLAAKIETHRDAMAPVAPTQAPAPLDPVTRRQLEVLGYSEPDDR